MERVTRLVCIFASQKLLCGAVKPSPATLIRVASEIFEPASPLSPNKKTAT
jgi:hypothetical protein